MEQLKDLLTRSPIELGRGSEQMTPKAYEQWKADEYNRTSGDLNAVDGYNCDACKNKGYIAVVTLDEHFGYYSETLTPCKCQRVRNAIRRLNRSGLKNIVKDYTFDHYEATEPWQTTLKEKAVRFCSDDKNGWFFMGGQPGCGKTHLCTAIAVKYIKRGSEVRYMLWRDEITRIKAVVNDAPAYSEIMDGLKKAPVLYIDDLFKSGKGEDGRYKPPTAADVNAAFEIINYRYNNPDLVTIISSERVLAELNEIDEAIAGRIAERTKAAGYCLNIKRDPARNWRMNGLQEI